MIDLDFDDSAPAREPSRDYTVIYALIDPRTSEIRYVGKTARARLRIRLTAHLRDKKQSWKTNWIAGLKTVGLEPESMVVEELSPGVSVEEWKEAECFWISYLKSIGCRLTNLTDGGEGLCGYTPTAEHRRKIGEAQIGRVFSEETRALMREARKHVSHEHLRKIALENKGKKLPPSQVAKMVEAQKGRKHTPETKARMSASAIGRKASKETRARMSEAQEHRSPEHEEKLAMSKRGKPFSPERCAKLSEARKGRIHSQITRALISEAHKKRNLELRMARGDLCSV